MTAAGLAYIEAYSRLYVHAHSRAPMFVVDHPCKEEITMKKRNHLAAMSFHAARHMLANLPPRHGPPDTRAPGPDRNVWLAQPSCPHPHRQSES